MEPEDACSSDEDSDVVGRGMLSLKEFKRMYLGEGLSGWFYRTMFERSDDILLIASMDIPNQI